MFRVHNKDYVVIIVYLSVNISVIFVGESAL